MFSGALRRVSPKNESFLSKKWNSNLVSNSALNGFSGSKKVGDQDLVDKIRQSIVANRLRDQQNLIRLSRHYDRDLNRSINYVRSPQFRESLQQHNKYL